MSALEQQKLNQHNLNIKRNKYARQLRSIKTGTATEYQDTETRASSIYNFLGTELAEALINDSYNLITEGRQHDGLLEHSSYLKQAEEKRQGEKGVRKNGNKGATKT